MAIQRPVPIVKQVEDQFREQIRSGELQPGQRLPSEQELSEAFGVSRATLRTVLTQLAAEGMILRRHGDGTYVNERLPDVNVRQGLLWDFGELIRSSGFEPGIEAISSALHGADEQTAKSLGIEPGDKVIDLVRLFRANGKPVILAQNTLRADYSNGLAKSIDGNLPLKEIILHYTLRQIGYAITDIRACTPDASAIKWLARETSDPMLKIEMTFYQDDNLPIATGSSWYDDDTLRLRQVQSWT
jgi:GntR family transcriptional regulator